MKLINITIILSRHKGKTYATKQNVEITILNPNSIYKEKPKSATIKLKF
jgi:hypothetical protein